MIVRRVVALLLLTRLAIARAAVEAPVDGVQAEAGLGDDSNGGRRRMAVAWGNIVDPPPPSPLPPPPPSSAAPSAIGRLALREGNKR